MIKLCNLGSGSSGNATYAKFDGYSILIDAGFSFKELKRRLNLIGEYIIDVRAIYISHDHKDHTQAIPQIKKHTDIEIHQNVFPSSTILSKDPLQIKSFLLPHDSPCYGFDFKYKDFKLTYIPDTGCITEDAVKALLDINGIENHVVIIECNYDLKMLAMGRYNHELKERIVGCDGHMDNVETGRILKEIYHDKLRLVLPFHLSTENNNIELVQYEVKKVVGDKVHIVCCEQNKPTAVFYYF